MNTVTDQLSHLLDAMERELRALELWSQVPPSPEAMSSDQPFCCDTLAFHEWLQWLFIGRMRELLNEAQPLPENCRIFPYAEESLSHSELVCQPLLSVIRQIDQLLSHQRVLH